MTRDNILIAGLILAIIVVAGFAWLAYQVAADRTTGFDNHVRETVHAAANPALTRAMQVMSFIGEPFVIWPLMAIAVFGLRRAGLNGWLLAIAMIGEVSIEQTLKFSFRRQRPTAYFGYAEPGSYSFPSGHALASLVFFATLAALVSPAIRGRWGKALLWTGVALLVAAIGFSRIYLGVHYPTDVIGGYGAGLVWVLAVAIGNRARGRRVKRL